MADPLQRLLDHVESKRRDVAIIAKMAPTPVTAAQARGCLQTLDAVANDIRELQRQEAE